MASTDQTPLSDAVLDRLDDACQRFEAAWQAGDPPDLAVYLRDVGASDATPVFQELLHLDLDYRSRRGESADEPTYLVRFPQHTDVIRAVFARRSGGGPVARAFETGFLPVIPGYEMVRLLGRGGMGVVFLARSQKLGRLVAVKMIAHAEDAGFLSRRFQTEAEAIARLQHPHIVQIFEVGETGGRAYLVLEYLAGDSLKTRLKVAPYSPRDAARLVLQLALAVHHAHSHGIVHRDLKPGNVLFTDTGEPRVADFGLARVLDAQSDATSTGQILGTLQYMAPEQATPNPVGAAADVYALGAILYEMLAGQPPFHGGGPLEILHRLADEVPAPPGRARPGVPRDLDAICLKCLEKNPARRYGSAEALADDLGRFLAGRPIVARPAGAVEVAGKWARRHPAVTGLAASLMAVIVAGFVLVTWKWLDAAEQKRIATASLAAEQEARAAESTARVAAETAVANEKQAHAMAVRDRDRAQTSLLAAQLARANAEMEVNYVGLAETTLDVCPVPERGWEHRYLTAECARRRAFWTETDLWWVSGGPGFLASVNGIWDGRIVFWDTAAGKPVRTVPSPVWATVQTAYDPATRGLAVGGTTRAGRGAVAVLDGRTGTRRFLIDDLPVPVTAVAFSPDGRWLACAVSHNTRRDVAAILDAATGAVVRWLTGPVPGAASVAFSSAGDRVAVGHGQGEITIWDRPSGKVQASAPRGSTSGPVAFGPDGRWVAGAGPDEQVRLYDPGTGRTLFSLRGHRHNVVAVTFDPNTNRLASLDIGGNIKLWDVDTRQAMANLRTSNRLFPALTFLDDGRRLAAVESTFKRIEVWNLTRPTDPVGAVPATRALCVTRGRVAYASEFHQVAVRDLATGNETVLLNTPPGPRYTLSALAVSSDGKWLAWGGASSIRIWDLSTGKQVHCFEGRQIECLAFHPDGKRLIGADEVNVKVWDIDTHTVVQTLPQRCQHLAISPDGTLLACATNTREAVGEDVHMTGGMSVWDLGTSNRQRIFDPSPGEVRALAFRPDGKELAGAGWDDAIRIWSVDDWSFRTALKGHVGAVNALAYHPDGRRLVSGGADKTVRVWDAETSQELLSLTGPTERITAVGFHPAGDLLLTADSTGAIRRWDAAGGRK